DPVGDARRGPDHDMAIGHRGDVEEGDALVSGVDEGAGNLAVDDLREQGGHGGVLLAVSDGPPTGLQNAARVSEAGTRRGEIAGEVPRLAAGDLPASDDRTRRRDDEDRPLGHSVDRIEDAEGGSDL